MTALDSHVIPDVGKDWAGSLPEFPKKVGGDLSRSYEVDDFRLRRLIFGRFDGPGAVHVYSAVCHAGARLRVQSYVPELPLAEGRAAAFAIVAQSLPYSADVHKLPFSLPAGYSAVVAQPPVELGAPIRDRLTGARNYPGPVIDTRTLVSGQCFIIVWSPKNKMGKYALHIGYQWPMSWYYWLRTPLFWWTIRGWYGLSRAKAYLAVMSVTGFVATVISWIRRRRR